MLLISEKKQEELNTDKYLNLCEWNKIDDLTGTKQIMKDILRENSKGKNKGQDLDDMNNNIEMNIMPG